VVNCPANSIQDAILGLPRCTKEAKATSAGSGAWAGLIFTTTDTEVLQSVAQEKWDKAKSQLQELTKVLGSSHSPEFVYKRLEQIRGFLCHLSMTYSEITPYLKGFHLTLAAHNGGRDDTGWKLTPREWAAYLYEAVEPGKMAQDEADDMRGAVREMAPPEPISFDVPKPPPKPPLMVAPVERFKDNVQALTTLLSQDNPSQKLIRASRVYTILYGFAEMLWGRALGVQY
jgi:hypothetical protein